MTKFEDICNPGKVFMLEQVKKRIQTGQNRFICLAVDHEFSGSDSAEAFKQFIRERISGYYTIENWLVNSETGPKLDRVYIRRLYNEKSRILRDYRVRWLDSLIKEFSN